MFIKKRYKKILLIIIVLEILIIFYLSNFNNSTQFNYINVEVPKEIFNSENTIVYSNYSYFYIPSPNISKTYTRNKDYGFNNVYATNTDGLRERYNYTREKPENTFRIGVFGDSFVEGAFVNISDAFTEVLEDSLNEIGCSNKFEVINFGVSGYDLHYMIELYGQKGKQYNSDINIFFVKDDDINNIYELWAPFLIKYEEIVGWPPLGDKNITKLTNLVHSYANEEYYETYDVQSAEWIKKYITEPLSILNSVNKKSSKIVIFTFQINNQYDELLKIESKKNNFNFFSINELGDNYKDTWNNKFSVIPDIDNHPNELGHEFLENFIYLKIVSNNLIVCETS